MAVKNRVHFSEYWKTACCGTGFFLMMFIISSCCTDRVPAPVPYRQNETIEPVTGPAASVVFPKPRRRTPDTTAAESQETTADKADAATLAFLQPDMEKPADFASLREKLVVLSALNPTSIIVFGPQNLQQQLEDGDHDLLCKRMIRDGALLLLPDLDSRRTRLAVHPAVGVGLYYVQAQSLAHASNAQNQGTWFLHQLDREPSVTTAVVILDEPVWEQTSAVGWRLFQEALAQFGGRLLVLAAGAERATWWEYEGIDYITLPRNRGGAMKDGSQRGDILWTYLSADEAILKILPLQSILPVRYFSRELQKAREDIAATVSSTALLENRRTTTVTCSNPTANTLVFETRWQFASGRVTVDPQILGFSLAPGEHFQQQFRFSQDTELPLKFMQPSFTLRTDLQSTPGMSTDFAITATPWCRMAGEVLALATVPQLDGSLDEWPGTGYAINHPTQVIGGKHQWSGPLDLSGRFNVAVADGKLFISGLLQDDQFASTIQHTDPLPMVHIFLDRGNATATDAAEMETGFGGEFGVAIVQIYASGKFEFIGADKGSDGLQVEVKHTENGFSYEVAVPLAIFAKEQLPSPLLMDVAIFDHDMPDAERTSLFYSGNLQNYHSNKLFAVFSVPENARSEAVSDQ